MGILGTLFVIILIVVPLWRIFDRTGRSGAWSLLAIVPGFGAALAALLWGFGSWPRFEGSAGTGPMAAGGAAGRASDRLPDVIHMPPGPPAT